MNLTNTLKSVLLFTIALVGTYGLQPVATSSQNQTDSLTAKSVSGNN